MRNNHAVVPRLSVLRRDHRESHETVSREEAICVELTKGMIVSLKDAAAKLTGAKRRAFQAQVTRDYLNGRPRQAERVFGWGRQTVETGLHELRTGIECVRDFTARGNKKLEEKCENCNPAFCCKKMGNGSSSSCAVYGIGILGAAYYFFPQAIGVGGFFMAILKSLVWPALLVYQALSLFKL